MASIGEPPLAYPPERRRRSARRAACSATPEPASIAFAAQPASGTRAARRAGHAGATRLRPMRRPSRSRRSFGELRPVQFTAVRYPGIDAVGHYYLRYALPRAFGDVSDEERLRHGRVLEQYYTYLDGIVGRAMASLGPDDLLLVVSGFGMEPLSLGKRVLERVVGDPELSGSHERAPDGFVIAYGRQVAQGQSSARVGRRHRADGALLLRPADCARSRRLRAHRHLHAQLHRTATDHVHPVLR